MSLFPDAHYWCPYFMHGSHIGIFLWMRFDWVDSRGIGKDLEELAKKSSTLCGLPFSSYMCTCVHVCAKWILIVTCTNISNLVNPASTPFASTYLVASSKRIYWQCHKKRRNRALASPPTSPPTMTRMNRRHCSLWSSRTCPWPHPISMTITDYFSGPH